ncbi:MAG: hypothetical protein BWY06_03047 [Candidatus Latescibacteria bacterium ADurb.Bin168]|nr:MAG: hypothetical protein BWY06_03047 [Candidatus Latescibacteria bacterium ADurb.Bin168]
MSMVSYPVSLRSTLSRSLRHILHSSSFFAPNASRRPVRSHRSRRYWCAMYRPGLSAALSMENLPWLDYGVKERVVRDISLMITSVFLGEQTCSNEGRRRCAMRANAASR